jgi:hypothetical protein
MSQDNLKLWNSVKKTNPKDTKAVNFGRKFTAIDAYSQIEIATSHFGSYGSTWGLYDIAYTKVEETSMFRVSGLFKYPSGEFPIGSSIFYISDKGKIDDEFVKKVETDMITKALSRLGFNADVFMGMFDDNRYVQEVKKEFEEKAKPKKEQTPELKEVKERLSAEIFGIKKAIADEDTKILVEAWDAINDNDKRLLWTKEVDFGPFSDVERLAISSAKEEAVEAIYEASK